MMDMRPISEKPAQPMAVLLYYANIEYFGADDQPVSFGAVRDLAEKCAVGFWDGSYWREAGTGHDIFEGLHRDNYLPTHWTQINAPGGDE